MIFFSHNSANFGLKQCESAQSYQKYVKIKFEVVLDELESKKCFQRQKLTKYLPLTVVFM